MGQTLMGKRAIESSDSQGKFTGQSAPCVHPTHPRLESKYVTYSYMIQKDEMFFFVSNLSASSTITNQSTYLSIRLTFRPTALLQDSVRCRKVAVDVRRSQVLYCPGKVLDGCNHMFEEEKQVLVLDEPFELFRPQRAQAFL